LKGDYPNPFNPVTTIPFDVNKQRRIILGIYNINGQIVETLVNGVMAAGSHRVVCNPSGQSSGVNIVTISSNGFMDTKKIMFIK
jgi:hypothetical protein